ncbi:glucose 1-dehydrogenase [Phenylobacterium sp.]|uniref:SDR family NAD(P)-dependent oxidoreductase n=1 Tax=Phenylobacterium sp. TaxID=1871053 RepID=UPI0025E0E349|nr:glucose 1-dehydrogenase [Phenylobacterium sp.]
MGDRLAGRVALVTGASRGLGRAAAELLAAEGCAVAVVDLKAHWAESAAEAIGAAGGRAIGLGCDVSDRAALQQALEATAREFGRLDVLVNNAMWNRYEPIGAISPATMDRMLGVGFEAVVWGIQLAAPMMAASGGGSIVNIASVSALLGIPNGLLYCGIKAAVTGLTRAAAAELGPDGIRVNAIAPSTVDTEGVRSVVSGEGLQRRIAQTPLGRLGTTEDIARAVRYLACDDSSFVTGQLLTVDGGLANSLS